MPQLISCTKIFLSFTAQRMRMRVCGLVVRVFMSVCVSELCVNVVHVCVHVVCMCVQTCVYVRVCRFLHDVRLRVCFGVFISVCVCMYVYVHVFTCAYVLTRVNLCAYMSALVCMLCRRVYCVCACVYV